MNVSTLNIQVLCLDFAKVLINTYRKSARLIIDGEEILSCEGTQVDPLAMGMYALSILPLVQQLEDLCKQVWYADDAAA